MVLRARTNMTRDDSRVSEPYGLALGDCASNMEFRHRGGGEGL